MNGAKARTAGFNTSGVVCNTWKSNEAKITIVGNMAAIPIQEKSRRECAEGLGWLWLGMACPCSSSVVWNWHSTTAITTIQARNRAIL
jgi:hypothetical protein